VGGVRFTIRTDHRNLLYLNNRGSRKVLKWKLDIKHYDAIIEYVPGELNIPADVLSRLVSNTSDRFNPNCDFAVHRCSKNPHK